MIARARTRQLISAYEEYHTSLVRLVQQSQPRPPSPVQPKLASPPRPTMAAAGGNGSSGVGDSPDRSRAMMGGGSNPFAEEEEEDAGRSGAGSLASLPVENAWA